MVRVMQLLLQTTVMATVGRNWIFVDFANVCIFTICSYAKHEVT